MPDYTVTDSKTGKTLTLRGDSPPTDAELEQIFGPQQPSQFANVQSGNSSAEIPERSVSGWFANLPSNAGHTLEGLWEGAKIAGPTILHGAKALSGHPQEIIEDAKSLAPIAQHPKEVGSAIWDAAKARYGGTEQIKKTLYEDPIGAALDLSTVFGGASAGAKLGGLSKTAKVLGTMEKFTNPATLVGKVAQAGLRETGIGTTLATLRPSAGLREDFGGARNIGKTIVDNGLTSHASVEGPLTEGRKAVDDLLATKSGGVQLAKVESRLMRDPFEEALRRGKLKPEDLTPEIEGRVKTMKNAFPSGTIPYLESNDLKRSAQTMAYESGRDNKTISKMADKAQAQGLRAEIETGVPEVGPMNQKEQNLLGASRAFEEGGNRETGLNHILTALSAGALGLTQNPLHGLELAGLGLALNSPTVGAKAAKGLTTVGKGLGSSEAAKAALILRLAQSRGNQ